MCSQAAKAQIISNSIFIVFSSIVDLLEEINILIVLSNMINCPFLGMECLVLAYLALEFILVDLGHSSILIEHTSDVLGPGKDI